MPRKRYSAEQIIGKLRESEIMQTKGLTISDICRELGVSEQTYYRWRREFGGLGVDQAKRLKQLEGENKQLRKLVADQALDMAILKEAASGNF